MIGAGEILAPISKKKPLGLLVWHRGTGLRNMRFIIASFRAASEAVMVGPVKLEFKGGQLASDSAVAVANEITGDQTNSKKRNADPHQMIAHLD
jgi:hypothetical protein